MKTKVLSKLIFSASCQALSLLTIAFVWHIVRGLSETLSRLTSLLNRTASLERVYRLVLKSLRAAALFLYQPRNISLPPHKVVLESKSCKAGIQPQADNMSQGCPNCSMKNSIFKN